MKLDKVLVGYQTYEIVNDTEHCRNFGALGVTHKDKALIVMDNSQSKESYADTLIHELLHAICHSYIPTLAPEEEESLITSLAHGLTQVIRDNPDVLKELKRLL